MKIAGALYLLYLAWQAFRAGAAATEDARARPVLTSFELYQRGVIMNITNPKVAIFFLAFLPQFADPARGSVTLQIFLFGGVFAATGLVLFSAVAWGAGFLGNWLARSPSAQTVLNRVAGVVFLGLAVRLLMAQR